MATQLTALAALLFCTVLSAETFAQAYLRPGYVSPVDRQLSHTSDGNGRSLPGWHPMQPEIRLRSAPEKAQSPRLQEIERERTQEMNEILDTVRFPRIEFEKTPLREAVDWLIQEIRAQTTTRKWKLFIYLQHHYRDPKDLTMVTLSLSDVTARQALEKVAELVGLKVTFGPIGAALYKQ